MGQQGTREDVESPSSATHVCYLLDPGLRRVNDLWDRLPESVREQIWALVEAHTKELN
jgi:hypothetical protein